MQFLLERLATCTAPAGHAEAFDLKAAVAAQIQRIVSARPQDGTSAATNTNALLDFGMPSVVELSLGSKSQLEKYAARLARQIARHEPRLLHPSVTVELAQGRLTPYRLVISGMLAPDGDVHTFHFDFSDL